MPTPKVLRQTLALSVASFSVIFGCTGEQPDESAPGQGDSDSVASRTFAACVTPAYLAVDQHEEYGDPLVNHGNEGALHLQAVNRQRRLIVNDDGVDVLIKDPKAHPCYPDPDEAALDRFLDLRLRPIFEADAPVVCNPCTGSGDDCVDQAWTTPLPNQVDAFVYEVTAGGFGSYTQPTDLPTPPPNNPDADYPSGFQRLDDQQMDADCIAVIDGDPLPTGSPVPDHDVPDRCNGADGGIPASQAAGIRRFRANNNFDPVLEAIRYVRSIDPNKEFLLGFRMNDWHDATIGDDEDYENAYSPLKLDDEPIGAFLFGRNPFRTHAPVIANLPPNQNVAKLQVGKWSAVDYGNIAIRNHVEQMVKEVLRNYSGGYEEGANQTEWVDGIQLNFWRHLAFFRSTAWGSTPKLATPCECDQMTDLMVRIRNQANKAANLRRKPVLISIIVPDSIPYASAVGLRLQEWYKRGLVDLVVGADYMQLQEWEKSVAQVHGYTWTTGGQTYQRMKFYAGFTDPRYASPIDLRITAEAHRGHAAEAWAEGVAGIHLSNGRYTDVDYRALYSTLGDPASATASEMVQFGSYMGKGEAKNILPFLKEGPDGAFGTPDDTNYFSTTSPRPLVAPNHPLRIDASATRHWLFHVSPTLQTAGSIYLLTEDITAAQRGTAPSYTTADLYLRVARDNGPFIKITPTAYHATRSQKFVDPSKTNAQHPILKWCTKDPGQPACTSDNDCAGNLAGSCGGRYRPRLLRYDIPAQLLQGETLKVEVVNDDAVHVSLEDIILRTAPTGPLVEALCDEYKPGVCEPLCPMDSTRDLEPSCIVAP